MNDIEKCETFERIIWIAHEKGMISDGMKDMLEALPHSNLDELENSCYELIHILKNQDYYRLLERIEKGQQVISEETNDLKRKKYQDGLNALIAEMESKRPEEHRISHDESA